MINTKVFLLIFLILVSVSVLFPAEGENLTLKIAVMGAGDEVYFWFGHIGLIIEDSITGHSRFYDYGLFSFDTENFYYNFAMGRMLYSCGVSPLESNIAVYIKRNRDIKIYTLDVPPAARIKVQDFVVNNIKPENRDYYYHHFKDNCSTRIRDIIDIATNGEFFEQFGQAPGRFTLREHVRRHTWFSPFADWILNFWMGQVIDTPINVWQEMFLPSEVARRIENFSYTGEDGIRRELVTSVEQIYSAPDRHETLDAPKKQWPRLFVFSFVLSVIFGFFFVLQEKKYLAGKILAGISMSLAGLVFGIAASALYFLNIFTNHDYTYQNFNMIFCTPLLLAAVPLGICYALTRKPDKLRRYAIILKLLWGFTALAILVSILLNLLPTVYQQNFSDQIFMLPITVVFTLQSFGISFISEKLFNRKKHEVI